MPYGSTLQFYLYNAPDNPHSGYAFCYRIPIDYSYLKIGWIEGFKYILAGFDKIRNSIKISTLSELDKICRFLPAYTGDNRTADAIVDFLAPSDSSCIKDSTVFSGDKALSVLTVKNPDGDKWITDDIREKYEFLQVFTIIRPLKKFADKLTDDVYEHRKLINSVVGDRPTSSDVRVDTIVPSKASDKFFVYKDAMCVCVNVSYAVPCDSLRNFAEELFNNGLLTYTHHNTLYDQYQALFPGNCYSGKLFQYAYYSGILKLLRNYAS
jgi:hypothetical protein